MEYTNELQRNGGELALGKSDFISTRNPSLPQLGCSGSPEVPPRSNVRALEQGGVLATITHGVYEKAGMLNTCRPGQRTARGAG